MARKKVRLEYIENDTARRVTYKKRVKGIVKKTHELSVLCGVDACTVIYGPYDQAPVVWPSSEAETKRILEAYKRKPEMFRCQRRFNQQTYLMQSVAKARDRLQKLQRRNREMQMEHLMADLLAGKPLEQVSFTDLGDLLWVICDKLKCIQHRIGVLEGANNAPKANANTGVNAGVNGDGGIMRGINNGMMEAGPSHLPSGSANGWHLG